MRFPQVFFHLAAGEAHGRDDHAVCLAISHHRPETSLVETVRDEVGRQHSRARPTKEHQHYLRCRVCGYKPPVASRAAERRAGTIVVRVSWFNSQGVFMSGSDSADLTLGDTDWTELEATATAPLSAAFAEIWLKSAHNSGTVWFADVTWTLWTPPA